MKDCNTNYLTRKEIEETENIQTVNIETEDYIREVKYFIKDRVLYLSLSDVAFGLGFYRQYRRNSFYYDNRLVKGYLEELGQPIEYIDLDYIPENVYYLLATKADGAATYEFQKKMVEEFLSLIHEQYSDKLDYINNVKNGDVKMKNQTENKLDVIDAIECTEEKNSENTDLEIFEGVSEFQVFENSEFGKLRIIDREGEVWFVGKDVAEMLGYKDTVNAIKSHVDTEDKMGWQITTPSRGLQKMTIINESGLYSLILSSKLKTAKQFKRWVTSEILPSIRKTGGYVTKGREKEFLYDPNSPIHSEVESLIKVISVLQKEVQSLISSIKVLKLPDKLATAELNEIKVNIWKKQVSTPIVNSIAEKFGISFEEALNLVYDRMKMDYGFSKGYVMNEFCDRYNLSYGMNNVSVITAIADNSIYQEYFVRAANTVINSIMYIKRSDDPNTADMENFLSNCSLCSSDETINTQPEIHSIDEEMKKIIKFKPKDNPDDVIKTLAEIINYKKKNLIGLYRIIYGKMATDRAWKVSMSRNRCKSKKQLVLTNDNYRKKFMQACNDYLQEA